MLVFIVMNAALGRQETWLVSHPNSTRGAESRKSVRLDTLPSYLVLYQVVTAFST